MTCRQAKDLYGGLKKKWEKAVHRVTSLDKYITKLQEDLEGGCEEAEKVYQLLIDLNPKREGFVNDVKLAEREIGRMEAENHFLVR